ncbi:hypothetical protein Ga0074812_13241 [Parafrankia irregularis]|uniref:Lipoprotein n=1 Tax=Parafrankia irregularis TaxID=795642 RepID=A0A0S4QY56_9ACTN|nr:MULTISPECIES: hypothetical protein [Parafrankia]MBE3202579.1 hypothetical protein [Parafrankia sp. CH37]CUU59836.1 hypothetical protein Ga0074812_13241 [Parafrankia irregularis]
MRRHTFLLVLLPVLATGLVACGSDEPRLTPDAYQGVLTDLDKSLDPAFDGVGAALTPEDLSTALTATATSLTSQADKLAQVRPPETVDAAHGKLRQALDELAGDLTSLSQDAQDKKLCTGGSGLPRAASADGANQVRQAAQELTTADSGRSFTVGAFLPVGTPDQTRRPANGSLPGGRGGGGGELTVNASSDADAVVKLTQGTEVIRNVYVQAGGSTTADGIPDGTYEVFYTVGTDWDDANARFTRDCDFSKFDETLSYDQYTSYELTLYGVISGNASTSSVDPGAFPGS